MAKLPEAEIERIAKQKHDIDSDNYTLPWGKQSPRFRSQGRRTVRDILYALECAGYEVTRRPSLSPE